MIVSNVKRSSNRVKTRRIERGWSQAELAEKAGISRAAVSAIEISRLVPSVAAALSLSKALESSVEDLFGGGVVCSGESSWAWSPSQEPCRYWQSNIGGKTLLYPVESTACGVLAHDGIVRNGSPIRCGDQTPSATLVMASCDPAVSLLAAELARSGVRLISLPRSSRAALELLRKGLVHVAGIHFSTNDLPNANVNTVREQLGAGFRLLRVARWQEGLSLGSGIDARSVRAAVNANLRWIGRESGSAARQCQDELRPHKTPPRHQARDHRGVAEAVRCGWADVGVCLRFVSEEAGLSFLPVREESYDLCYPVNAEGDPRIQAMVRAVRSMNYRGTLGELPGFETTQAGELLTVN